MQKSICYIPTMDCPAEEALIRSRLSSMEGIFSLEFNLLQQQLTVFHNLGTIEPIKKALKEIGIELKNEDSCCNHKDNDCNEQSQIGNSTPSKEWILLAISGIAALSAEITSFMYSKESSVIVVILSIFSILLSGKETFIKGIRAVHNFTLNINFLMTIAVTGAILIGDWPEAAMVTCLFAIAEMIEKYSLDKARNAIRSLIEITPETATVRTEENKWEQREVSTVIIDQIIWVKPGERIPLDGMVTSGKSNVNQAPITGESMPVSKNVGDHVFAGSINEQGSFEFKVTTAPNDTTLARIIRAIQQAQSEKAPTERFIDQFSKYYTPTMVIIAIFVVIIPPLFYGAAYAIWLYKALVLLVIACPCALVISTPVTLVSGLASAAKQGILVKGGAYLELGHQLKAIALDKTGTLTLGKPVVTNIISLKNIDEQQLLRIAASLNNHSDHPIARAVISHWNDSKQQEELFEVSEFESITGRGVSGIIDKVHFYLGNHRLIEERNICNTNVELTLTRLEKEGKTTMVLCNNKEPIAVLAVADTLRNTSIEALKELHALKVIPIMMTGDNAITAKAIAERVGINDVRANLLPEDKLSEITNLLEKYKVVGMVGDGINDAPALAKSSIGFAMGAAGTDTAIETADVALMEDNLNKLPFFIKLSKKTTQILTQNITLSISIKLIFFILALIGKATLWMAVFADMGASLIVVFNGLRLLHFTTNRE